MRKVEPSLMVKKDGMILELPSLMVKKVSVPYKGNRKDLKTIEGRFSKDSFRILLKINL